MKWHLFDHGWFYVIAGLVLMIAAIVLPAMDDLQGLKSKEVAIEKSRNQLLSRKDVYAEFLIQLSSEDATIQSRLIDMQFKITPKGIPIVIDTAASHTPLQWIELKTSQFQAFDDVKKKPSLLTSLTFGTRRLWMAGFGVTIIFLGIVLSPSSQSNEAKLKVHEI